MVRFEMLSFTKTDITGAPVKAFADATSRFWASQQSADKIA